MDNDASPAADNLPKPAANNPLQQAAGAHTEGNESAALEPAVQARQSQPKAGHDVAAHRRHYRPDYGHLLMVVYL